MGNSTSPLLVLLAAMAVAALIAAPVSSADLPSGFTSITSKIPNPWSAFKNLTGCHFGEQQQGIAKVKDYLSHFGYLPESSGFTDMFDADLEEAIKVYQRNFGLDISGAMDAPTVAQMMAPRCGVADVINGTSTMGAAAHAHGRNLYSYFPGSPTWPRSRKSLRYAIAQTAATPAGIDRATLSQVFARAFARWSAATTLNFTEVASASGDADITIGFYAGDHGDGEAFDGPLGTLAHAFSPRDGRFHLDAAEAWVAAGDVSRASSDVAVDLESVAVHEIGHLLGLGHSSAPAAIMYPTITSRTRKVDLAEDDVVGIQSLYGGNPNFKGVAPPATSSRDMDSGAGVTSSRPWSALVAAVAVAAGIVVAL